MEKRQRLEATFCHFRSSRVSERVAGVLGTARSSPGSLCRSPSGPHADLSKVLVTWMQQPPREMGLSGARMSASRGREGREVRRLFKEEGMCRTVMPFSCYQWEHQMRSLSKKKKNEDYSSDDTKNTKHGISCMPGTVLPALYMHWLI